MKQEDIAIKALLNEARQIELKGKHDDAIEKYTKVLLTNPNCTTALEKLGLVYERRGEFEQAISYRKRVIELKSRNNLAYAKLARLMMRLKRIGKAILFYQKAISLKSKKNLPPWVYSDLGDALCQKGNVEKAITIYQKGVEFHPDSPINYMGLGLTLFKQEKWQEAIEYFKKALNKNPSRKIVYKIVNNIGNLNEKDLLELLDSASDLNLREVHFASEGIHLYPVTTIVQKDSPYFNEKTYINPKTRVFELNNLNYSTPTRQLFFVSQHGGPPHNNYYHWMFQMLPQVDLWRRSIIDKDDSNKIVFPFSLRASFQHETLSNLGLKNSQIIELADRDGIQANNSLLFASSLQGNPRKWIGDFLRREFLPRQSNYSNKLERIHICRKKAAYRRVINQDEFNNYLDKLGFKSIYLESLSVREQAELFSKTNIVLSLHGAGLTNIVFCQPHTKIIEIFPQSSTPIMYRKIASYYDLEYYYLLCEDIDNSHSKEAHYLKDLIVNVNHLSELMNLANIY